MRKTLVTLLLLPTLAQAQALPVFNPTGPDAASYGEAEHYPVHPIGPNREQRYLVGAFSHDEQLARHHPVPKPAAPSPLARAPRELAMHYRFQNRVYSLAEYLDRNPATGLLILQNDTILFEHYQYDRRDTDRFLSQSMAKTVTAMLVGLAVQHGQIRSIDDLAQAYVPELAGSEIGGTPIRALLHMASGIAFREVYDGKDDAAALGRALWSKSGQGAIAAIRGFNTREAPPGAHWHYKGLDTETIGLILTRATGKSLAELLATQIWQPMGAEADALWTIDAHGQEAAFCCLSATLRDYARLGALLANQGTWNGRQILPPDWIRAAATPEAENFAPGHEAGYYGYGYQVWLPPGDRHQMTLLGIHGQSIFIDPASKLVLVHTAVRPQPTGGAAELTALWRALVAQSGM